MTYEDAIENVRRQILGLKLQLEGEQVMFDFYYSKARTLNNIQHKLELEYCDYIIKAKRGWIESAKREIAALELVLNNLTMTWPPSLPKVEENPLLRKNKIWEEYKIHQDKKAKERQIKYITPWYDDNFIDMAKLNKPEDPKK